MDAGLRHARGEVIVTLDADLQNDPADIPKLLALMPDYDVVCGVRAKRQDDWVRRVSSRIANGVRNRVTHEDRPAARDEVVGQRHGAGDEEMKEEAEGGGRGAALEARLAQEAGGHRLEDAGRRQVRFHRTEDAGVGDIEGSGKETASEHRRPGAFASVFHGEGPWLRVGAVSTHR